jgi:AcrR family transcriptional regulator
MARRPARTQPPGAASPRGRKSTQRERLVHAMSSVGAREGYADATIARVIAHAGVSRPTFYDYFNDKDDCFLAALADVQRALLAEVQQAVGGVEPQNAAVSAVEALVGFASTRPEMARLLMNESMAAGRLGLDARDGGIAEIAGLIEGADRQAPSGAAVPDLCSAVLVGGVYRLLAARLRRGEPGVSGLREDLTRWVASYGRPAGEHRWRTLEPIPLPVRSQQPAPLLAPPPLPPGRPRASAEEVLHSHRQRILFATAEVARDKGYPATTIAAIIKLARVDARVFYRLFADKQEAFAAVHEFFFQHMMASAASAFFTGQDWPERVWRAGRAFGEIFEQNPTLAYIAFVEGQAGGPLAVQRLEDAVVAFTIFLQEGYQFRHQSTPPPSLALEAIAATNFEIAYRQTRHDGLLQLVALLPHATHLALVPFLGAAEADGLVDEKVQRERAAGRAGP